MAPILASRGYAPYFEYRLMIDILHYITSTHEITYNELLPAIKLHLMGLSGVDRQYYNDCIFELYSGILTNINQLSDYVIEMVIKASVDSLLHHGFLRRIHNTVITGNDVFPFIS